MSKMRAGIKEIEAASANAKSFGATSDAVLRESVGCSLRWGMRGVLNFR